VKTFQKSVIKTGEGRRFSRAQAQKCPRVAAKIGFFHGLAKVTERANLPKLPSPFKKKIASIVKEPRKTRKERQLLSLPEKLVSPLLKQIRVFL
jgi:hypothetical protein